MIDKKIEEELQKIGKNLEYFKEKYPEECVYSDEILSYMEKLYREILTKFEELYDFILPFPSVNFFYDEMEIGFRWELRDFKLVINLYDDEECLENDVIVYVKKYEEYGNSSIVKRSEIVSFVIKELYDYLNHFDCLCEDIEMVVYDLEDFKIIERKKDEITIITNQKNFGIDYVMAFIVSPVLFHECKLKIEADMIEEKIIFNLDIRTEKLWYKGKIIIVK